MSNLRFRCLVDSDFCDIAPFEPYIEKGSLDMGLALIAFDESELDTIKNLLKEAQLEGSNGYLYILYTVARLHREKGQNAQFNYEGVQIL